MPELIVRALSVKLCTKHPYSKDKWFAEVRLGHNYKHGTMQILGCQPTGQFAFVDKFPTLTGLGNYYASNELNGFSMVYDKEGALRPSWYNIHTEEWEPVDEFGIYRVQTVS